MTNLSLVFVLPSSSVEAVGWAEDWEDICVFVVEGVEV